LHFACLRGDWDILKLLLEAGAACDVKDDSNRFPQEYFDLERVNLETYKAYHSALKMRHIRWRSIVKKGKDIPSVSMFILITCIICRHNGTL